MSTAGGGDGLTSVITRLSTDDTLMSDIVNFTHRFAPFTQDVSALKRNLSSAISEGRDRVALVGQFNATDEALASMTYVDRNDNWHKKFHARANKNDEIHGEKGGKWPSRKKGAFQHGIHADAMRFYHVALAFFSAIRNDKTLRRRLLATSYEWWESNDGGGFISRVKKKETLTRKRLRDDLPELKVPVFKDNENGIMEDFCDIDGLGDVDSLEDDELLEFVNKDDQDGMSALLARGDKQAAL